jgi:transcriptional regulator with XRE-family HTH domain
MADTLIARAAKERSRILVHRLAGDLADARQDRGVSQRALAAAAEIDQSALSRIEAGKITPSIQTLVALATALGMEASVRLYPTVGPRLHDRTSAPITDALLAIAHTRWTPRLEVFVLTPAKGVIDVVFTERHSNEVVAAEIQGQLRRVEQQLRWAGEKADSLQSARGWPWTSGPPRIARLLVLRSTADTRALVRGLPELFRAAYPAPETEAYGALTSQSAPWPGHALLWAEVAGARARILDDAPRGAGR